MLPLCSGWRWRQVEMKHWYPTATLHGITTQKSLTWNMTTVKASKLALSVVHCSEWDVLFCLQMLNQFGRLYTLRWLFTAHGILWSWMLVFTYYCISSTVFKFEVAAFSSCQWVESGIFNITTFKKSSKDNNTISYSSLESSRSNFYLPIFWTSFVVWICVLHLTCFCCMPFGLNKKTEVIATGDSSCYLFAIVEGVIAPYYWACQLRTTAWSIFYSYFSIELNYCTKKMVLQLDKDFIQ
jgi:hypothetical protein